MGSGVGKVYASQEEQAVLRYVERNTSERKSGEEYRKHGSLDQGKLIVGAEPVPVGDVVSQSNEQSVIKILPHKNCRGKRTNRGEVDGEGKKDCQKNPKPVPWLTMSTARCVLRASNVQDDCLGVAFEPFSPAGSRFSGGVAKEQIYDARVEGQAFGRF